MAKIITGRYSDSVAGKKRLSLSIDLMKRLFKEKPLGTIGMFITSILLLTGIFADAIAPYGLNEIFIDHLLSPPSDQFLLGTDNLGRDILSRIIYGARISVIVGLAGSTVASLISVILGLLCGYIGGNFDLIVQRIVDAVMCLPSLILLIVVLSIVGPGIWQVVIVLGLRWGITGSRVMRSAVIGIRENIYIKAAKAIGCPTAKILIRHILPNIMSPAIIQFSVRVPAVIMTEASLSFLGFGIPPPTPSWGGMLSGSAREYFFQAPWMAIWPGLALAVVVYGVNMFGDALRDLLDPRLKGGVGGYRLGSKRRVIQNHNISGPVVKNL